MRSNKATDSASEDKDSILQYPTCKLKSQALAGEFLFLAWLFQRLLTNNEPTCSVIGTTFMSNIWALSESKTLLRCKRPSLLSRHLPQAQHQFSLFSDLSANILEIEGWLHTSHFCSHEIDKPSWDKHLLSSALGGKLLRLQSQRGISKQQTDRMNSHQFGHH